MTDRPTLDDDILEDSLRHLMLCGDRFISIEDYRAAVEILFAALQRRGWKFCRAISVSHSEESRAT